MNSIIAVLSGFCGGFCSSAPLGPINLMLADMVFQKRQRSSILIFLSGVVLTDVLYAAAAAWGYAALFQQSPYLFEIQIIGGLFLIGLGIASLVKQQHPSTTAPQHQWSVQASFKDFWMGAFLCGSNPSFILFWLFAIDSISSLFHIKLENHLILFFLAGIVLGDSVWFSTMARLAQHGQGAFSEQTLRKIRVGIALGFIALGSLVMMGASSQSFGVL